MSGCKTSISCPVCSGPLQPRVLACRRCEVRVEGPFEANEFASLDERLLHFLRIFVHCEGRIKDMEKSLGVSYPTVKGLMAELKSALSLPAEVEAAPTATAAPTAPRDPTETAAILAAMARGEIPYERALELIRRARK